jgi:hypothetical protein
MKVRASGGLMFFVLVYLIVQLSGCTLIGMGIGSAIDSSSPGKTNTLPRADMAAPSTGKQVTVVLKSGILVDGTLVKVYQLTREEYAPFYPKDEKLGAGALRLPRLGETLNVVQSGGKTSAWEFCGFDQGGMIALRRPPNYVIVRMLLAGIQDLRDDQGEPLDRPFLMTSVRSAQVPFLTALWLSSGSRKVLISSDQIQEIRVIEKSKSGKTTFMVLGAILDAVIIAGALAFSGFHLDFGRNF